MPNRLADQTSPYLLQHAENPIDWQPWGPEALDRARREDKPIFLSIGYSACHWCHVMAHESFEDPEVADFLNRHFISIKVDREEHPELDQIYMEAVQVLTGHGGWPLSVFLTPDREPFFGGTYWPPEPRGQMPSFFEVIHTMAGAWRRRRAEVEAQAGQLTALLRETAMSGLPRTESLGPQLSDQAYAALSRSFDPHYGGFGRAPKFPHPMELRLLLRRWRRAGHDAVLDMVRLTLDRMASGGIYDHLGGGFHRYSTDDRWLVPHFEKMLYDNALLSISYLEGWQATGNPRYARVVRETLDYVLREMTGPAGGFYSTEDADSEGEEGRFYLWAFDEIVEVLGAGRADTFAYVYDVTPTGNFEGRNILNMPKTVEQAATIRGRSAEELQRELDEDRRMLFEARSKRARPGRDDKVLVGWNGLMIEALALAGAALDEPRYTESAARAADFLLSNLRRDDGRLWHSWRQDRSGIDAVLEDYASLANALVSLYEAHFEERWIDEAVRLADRILADFADADGGGFYMTAADHPSLLVRKKDMYDSATPSGGGLATTALVRLGKLCGRSDYLEAAEIALRASVPLMEQAPVGTGQLLLALDMHLGPTPEVVILGAEDRRATEAVLGEIHHRYLPNKVVAFREASGDGSRSPSLQGTFEGKQPIAPGPTVYICEHFACQAPISGAEAALATLDALAAPAPSLE